jgi:AraC-like DNA-binding protein
MPLGFQEWTYALERAYDDRISPAWIFSRDYIDSSFACWFIRTGRVEVSYGGTTACAGPGDWLFNEPFVRRSQHFSTDTELISIRFQAHNPVYQANQSGMASYPVSHAEFPELLEAGQELARFERAYTPPLSPDKSCRRNALFYDWLSHWHRTRATSEKETYLIEDPRIVQTLEFLLHAQPAGPIDYTSLRESVQLSRIHIDRLFKNALGMSPRAWKERHCLHLATRHLNEESNPVKWIAYELGFVDAAHFCRWFKTKTSLSPSAFRRSRMV